MRGVIEIIMAILALLSNVTGTASFVDPAYGPKYLALPQGPGHLVRICGDAGCVTRISNDAGPDRAMQRAGRVADLSHRDFAIVCGCDPYVRGLTRVTVTYGIDIPAPPETSTEP